MDSSRSKAAERPFRPATSDVPGGPGAAGTSAAPRPSSEATWACSRRSHAEHQQVGKRLLWSLPAALSILGLLLILGPNADEIERRLTFYGKEGPLRIMPEIAVDDGHDAVEQQLRPQAPLPRGAPEYEIVPEDPLPQETTPPPREAETRSPLLDLAESDEAPHDAVVSGSGSSDSFADLLMPSQHAESDFVIRKLVRPLYPVQASMADRQAPLLVVEAAFYLDQEGTIVAVIIQNNEGGPEFGEAVREAMLQWEFEPRWRDGKPPAPRWLVVTWRFRSPFRSLLERP